MGLWKGYAVMTSPAQVSLPGLSQRLILTMAPLDGRHSTVEQFWRMVAQQAVQVIVMLCSVQKGFSGCSQAQSQTDLWPGQRQ